MLPELTTSRLVLRELAAEYAPALQQLQDARRDDPGRSASGDLEDQATRIANYETYRGPDYLRRIMAYVALSHGAPIGTASLSRAGHPQIGAISYFVGDAYQGCGFGTEMATRILKFGFEDCGMHRIEADVEIGNISSRRVAERIGMLREGIMRECTFADGRWWTDAKYAILATDWVARADAQQPPFIASCRGLRGGGLWAR